MTVKKRIGRLLWVVVGLLPASARAQNGIDPGAQPDPAVDCRLACELAFREAIGPCIRADGTIDEACAAGAKEAHEACMQACPPVEPPPPDCVTLCEAAFNEAIAACSGAGGILDEACVAGARQVFEGCIQGCGPIDPPPPPPDCLFVCEAAFREAVAGCGGQNGIVDEACVAGAKQVFEGCLQNCDPAEPPPPPGPDCAFNCNAIFQQTLERCVSPNGTIDQQCAARAGASYEACLKGCNIAPDPQQQCLLVCDAAFQDAASRCTRENGTVDEECLAAASATYKDCVTACGVVVPGEILCGMQCEAAYFAALSQCGDPAVGNNEIDAECAQRAHLAFEACFAGCGIVVPPEIACATGCDLALKDALAACGEDGECQQLAFASYQECLQGCGFNLPDLPDPDPCLSTCDRAYGEGAAACFDATNGEPDQECLAAVDQRYLACLESCGVQPGPLPPGDNGCLGHCDEAYRKQIGACADPAGNVLDPECMQAADRALADCLGTCGVGLPDDVPGVPPTEQCAAACTERFQSALKTCVGADGTLDAECAEEVAERIEACMEECEADAEARVLAALARTAGDSFLRGDANFDRRRDISDAVAILSFLFTGGERPACADAADANDDGLLNITDPVAILDFLFRGSGALPAPSAEAGTDPTADELDCST